MEAGSEKGDGADKLRSVGYMLILTCPHVLHHIGHDAFKFG